MTDSGDEIKCVGLFMAYKEENRLRVKALSYQVELVHSEEAKSIKKGEVLCLKHMKNYNLLVNKDEAKFIRSIVPKV